ncbi:hypothetical protein [Microbacterium sp. SORGH_AS_0888]|uniref:hypothetical protein n=1 Tax=Microbacterium sp. SORGH_AS_0888 TaxID=3041791 RepID=UPI00278247DB|nr:hypothetical protein [Microbacterium sp. SORGH_AS_0888]MDQ1130243.1 hypothetical protein [Microbacterium sp. SORGH_AS_0888]
MSVRITEPGMFVTRTEFRMLLQLTNLSEVRKRLRGDDSPAYRLLHDITVLAYSADAANGTEPRHPAASEEADGWTVRKLARATGRAERTIRKDISDGILPATKWGNTWLINPNEAHTYVQSRRREQ